MKKHKKILFLTLLFLIGCGTSYAYLGTQMEPVYNVFTVGEAGIELEEPSWTSGSGKDLVPGDVVAKDPQVTNTGETSVYTFLFVDIPIKSVRTVDPSDPAALIGPQETELFTFTAADEWTLVTTEDIADDGSGYSYKRYVYGYNEALDPDAVTTALFTELQYINIVEGDVTGTVEVPVSAAAVQSDHLGEAGNINEAYEIYKTQSQKDS